MERQSRSNSLGSIRISYIGKNIELATTDNVKTKREKTSLIKQYLIDYTANTNLHGLKYVGEKERTTVEKIFWLLMFTCCIVFCAGLIWKLWIKWNDNPVIVSFAETSTPVWQISYPAVTLCPESKVMQRVFNYTEYYHLEESDPKVEEQHDLFEDISIICNKNVAPWIQGREFSLGNKTVENIKKVSQKLDNIIFTLMWKDKIVKSYDLFSPILTEEGYCYTFNTISADELFRMENLNTDYHYYDSLNKSQTWTLENGYSPNTPLETYPHRGTGYGENAGLLILLMASEKDFDYLCSGPTQGFKVNKVRLQKRPYKNIFKVFSDVGHRRKYFAQNQEQHNWAYLNFTYRSSQIILHNPAEIPQLSQQYFRVPLDRDVVVAVKPKMMTTSDGLKPYSPVRRQCYFPSERYLRFFKVYTQANCETECLTNFTYVRCGCVHFGIPHGPEMKVCSLGKRQCMNDARMELVTIEIQNNLKEATNAHNRKYTQYNIEEARRVATNCKCLPACTSIEYEAETSQADFNFDAVLRANNFEAVKDNESIIINTQIKIFFKEAQFIKVRRSELHGLTDFLANCGGLLGLFLGFSLLSVVELIYFFTLRVGCILWRRGKNKNT